MHTNTVQESKAHKIKAEEQFLNSLEKIFTPPFSAKIYPSIANGISQARVNTEETLVTNKLVEVIALAKNYDLHLELGRSGAGLKIEFSQQ